MTTAGKEFNLDHLTVADKRQVEENRSGTDPDGGTFHRGVGSHLGITCLLYTSDAADE